MVSMKVLNDEVWKAVKEGEVKGFSIEGYFADSMERPKESIEENACSDCLDELNAEYELAEVLASLTEDVELESYGGYPQSAKNNAKRGIGLNEKLNNKCATQVGKVKSRQLEKGENFTLPTLKRIYSIYLGHLLITSQVIMKLVELYHIYYGVVNQCLLG